MCVAGLVCVCVFLRARPYVVRRMCVHVEQQLRACVSMAVAAAVGVLCVWFFFFFLGACVVSLLCVSSEPRERLAAYSGRCGPCCAQLAWAAGGCWRAQCWEEGVWVVTVERGGDTGRGLGISRAEVYDWTLWQMWDLVTSATNTALNPHFSLTPCTLSLHLHHVSSPWEGDGDRETERRAHRDRQSEMQMKWRTTGRLGCLTFHQIPPLFHSSGRSPDGLGGKPAWAPACLPAFLGCPSCMVLTSLARPSLCLHFVNSLLPKPFVRAERKGDGNGKQSKNKTWLRSKGGWAKREHRVRDEKGAGAMLLFSPRWALAWLVCCDLQPLCPDCRLSQPLLSLTHVTQLVSAVFHLSLHSDI